MQQPDYRYKDLMQVVQHAHGNEEHASKLVALKSFREGQVMVVFANDMIRVKEKRWRCAAPGVFVRRMEDTRIALNSSVQISAEEHVELNSELIYLNHSCDPNCVMDVERFQLVARKPIQPGDELHFFYPSTEWEMAQPFPCWCASKTCLKVVKGAKYLPRDEWAEEWPISKHIQQLQQLLQ